MLFLKKYFFETIIIILILLASILLLPNITRYHFNFSHKQTVSPYGKLVFNDLNNDGKSERIEFTNDPHGNANFNIKDGNKFQGQWKFSGIFASHDFFKCLDFNNNGFKEIYTFTISNDSLFLNAIESFTTKTIIKDRFISKLKFLNNDRGIIIYMPPNEFDLDADGYKELFFVTFGGYDYVNRGLFCYNIRKDSLIIHNNLGSIPHPPLSLVKFDTNFVISGQIRELGNAPTSYPFNDSSAWIMAWNQHLNFVFDPVCIGEYPSDTYTIPLFSENQFRFVSLYHYSGIYDTSRLIINDNLGKIVKQKVLDNYYGQLLQIIPGTTYPITISLSSGYINVYNEELKLIKQYKSTDLGMLVSDNLDFTNDGVPDLIYYNGNTTSLTFLDPVTLAQTQIPMDEPPYPMVMSKYRESKNSYLCCKNDDLATFYKFSVNPFYRVRYLLPFFLLLIIIGIKQLVLLIFRYYLNKRINNRNEIARLQLLNVKNQLDSHFTFNMIDCIGNNFRKNDFDTADKLFTRYARMLQQSVQLSNEIAIPMDQELDYVENYLNLEQARLNHKFTFELSTDTYVNSLIPKYLLFSFAENAVKHGIAPMPKGYGKISIHTTQNGKMTLVTIEDNGIGMDNDNTTSKGTGNGLKIIDQLISLFKTEYKILISYEYLKIQNPGTQVKISIKNGN